MAAVNYDAALVRLLAHEGGYTNHPADPGGPTNFGITIHDYRRYVKPGATAADVKDMKVEEAKRIYRAKYWDAQRCDELPAGVDYAVFDYGVNSGIGRSKKVLQRVLRVTADGVIGTETMGAVRSADPRKVINAICDERLAFLKHLRTWPVFGKGWGRRVVEVRSISLAFAAKKESGAPLPKGHAGAKALKEPAKASTTTGVSGAAAAGMATVATSFGWSDWQIIVSAIAAFVVVAIAVHFISKRD